MRSQSGRSCSPGTTRLAEDDFALSRLKILPGYAAIERGASSAIRFFVYEQSKGVIGDLVRSRRRPHLQSQEVEVRLLTHVIETIRNRPGSIASRPSCWPIETGEVVRPFCNRVSAGITRLY